MDAQGEVLQGVSKETTTVVLRLKEMAARGELLFSSINVYDCVTKSKSGNVYGCRHSLINGIIRATDVMIGGTRALIRVYANVGKGCAFISECEPICALQACLEDFQVAAIESVVSEFDIVVSSTGNLDIIFFWNTEGSCKPMQLSSISDTLTAGST